MTDVLSEAALGDFQLLAGPDDALVAGHHLHGVAQLPELSHVDVLLRAAARRGLDPDGVELSALTFPGPVSFADGRPRRLVYRATADGAATRVHADASPVAAADEGEPVLDCLVRWAGAEPSGSPLDVAAHGRAAATAVDLAELYARAERSGLRHGEFLRARGWVGLAGDDVVAQLTPSPAAADRSGDFLAHPALLEAALIAAFGLATADGTAPYRPRSIRLVRAPRRLDGLIHLVARIRPAGDDALDADIALYDADGHLAVRLEGVHAVRAAATTERPTPTEAPAQTAPRRAPRPPRPERRPLDVAIVGVAGRYPGAGDLDAFWGNLLAGHDAITEVPAERWRAEDYPTGELSLPRYGGFIADVDKFDPLFFRIPPSTAATLDPQERLFLEAAYAAVEHAGYQPDDFRAPHNRVGVFVGAMWADYRLLGVDATRRGTPMSVPSMASSVANRVSYFFDFAGPSMAVDTACSSSLTALHLACRSIAEGECDAAIAGGVNLLLHPDKFLLLRTLNMAASDGRCRSFGEGGDGYVPGEGVGALLLKPLAKAEEDGDTIHGVILGMAVNHGGRAAGLTVPNPVAQGEAISRALGEAQVDPGTIGYVEAHGTGTALGDPVEVAGLNRALAGRSDPCLLGSVKSNIGHLEAAAGVAAVTKVLLQMRHGTIAPSLHSDRLNPEIDFSAARLRVPQDAQPWPRPATEAGGRRRAGISSFGAGGANAHVVIEEYVAPPLPVPPAEPEVLVLSARTEERLRAYAGRIAAFLRGADPGRFRDVARTLQVGRPALEVRLALVAATPEEAATALERYLAGEPTAVHRGTAAGEADREPGRADLLGRHYAAGDLDGTARLWTVGGRPDWAVLNGGPARRVPVPGYPLQRTRYWLDEPADASSISAITDAYEAGTPHLDVELEAAYPLLGRYASASAARKLSGLGFPAEGGTVEEVRERLGIRPEFFRFFDACLAVLERHGHVEREGDVVRLAAVDDDLAVLRGEILEGYPEAYPFVRLLDTCVQAYPHTLRGEIPVTEVLFPGSGVDLMAGVYRGSPAYDFYSEELARLIGTLVDVRARAGRRPVRILEVGAGTGSTSHAVLAAVAARDAEVEYHYTDVGGSFVAHGRRTFGGTYPFVRFKVLDAERDPVEQGFAEGGFDAVFAASALHAVADVDESLSLLRRLLAPTGLLVLGEPVADIDILTLSIGMLDGWHRYTDPRRRLPNSPLLSVEQWREATRRTGYRDFTGYGPGLTADADPSFRVIVAANSGAPVARPALPAAPAAPAEPEVPAPLPEVPAETLEPVVAAIIADGLGVGTAEVRPTMSFAEYGVDSILAVKLVERLNAALGVTVKPTVVFDHPSVRRLAAHFASIGARVVSAVAAPPVAAPPVAAPPVVAPPAAPAAPAPAVEPQPRPAPVPLVGTARTEPSRTLDIAVIGMAGRYPGARDTRALWQNLVAGEISIGEVPAGRFDIDAVYAPWPPRPGRTYTRWGGYLDDVDLFDPAFFNIVPAEADYMDPQQRLFLQEAWRAVEDAGLDPRQLARTRCGVFAGSPPSDYVTLIRDRGLGGVPHVFTGNAPSILPARVAYHLDLTGPCMSFDTACSSSLVAIHQACRSIAAGDCDLALAGGVAVYSTLDHLLLTSSLGMLSPTGQCRAFDATADGFVMAEGAGVVLLKPLAKALADGDPIHGVIKAAGVNQDGRTNGITAPSARSQRELEAGVYDRFGIDPADIGYVETHGTGTRLGDPIEIEALTGAFRRYTDTRRSIPIGSIKTNIGHSSHAAGVAGLIKVLLAMREGYIPPSLNFTEANQLTGLAESPFYVNTDLLPWPAHRRLAAISSFGFSGTNAHLVVAGHDERRPATPAPAREALVPLSARSDAALRRGAADLERALAGLPDAALHGVAATMQTGRMPFEHRAAVVAGSVEQLRARLARLAAGGHPAGVHLGHVDPDAPAGPVVAPEPGGDPHEAGRAWAAGGTLDPSRMYPKGTGRRLHLPGYSFDTDRCWLPDDGPDGAASGPGAAPDGPTGGSGGPGGAGREPDGGSASPAAPQADPPVPAAPAPAAPEVVAVPAATVDPGVDTVDSGRFAAAVIGAAAAELGVDPSDVDIRVPAAAAGLDTGGRARLVGRINDALGVRLGDGSFPAGMSLAAFAVGPVRAALAGGTPPAGEPDLVELAQDYLKQLLATEARLPMDRIRVRAPLSEYGIESVLITQLNQHLEDAFGAVSATLFFEYQSIAELAAHLAGTYPDRLRELTAPRTVPAPQVQAPAEPAARPRSTGGERPRTGDIAVIGMAGRYPMARDNDEFWRNLLDGRDCIVEVPADRWDHAQYLSDDPDEPGTTYARWGGFIDGVDEFDARFFQIPPKEAEGMDPQQRLFLQAAWSAVEDAGYTPARIRSTAARRGTKDAGVFAGVTYGDYQLLVGMPIVGYWAVANRVSYHLGLNGPSMAVDTACSASMTAVHLAVESLRRGECGYAIAGGVNVTVHPGKFLLLGHGRWASTDGRCRAFGAGGDGYVPSEGVAALVLKPLADAEEDGDRIYGIIRGSTVNHGGRTNGFNVPSPNAQAGLVGEALRQAGVDPRELSYVEAHGTGTSLGDPIEITALTKAFREHTGDRGFCVIGSAKASVGHLEAAAGVTGIVKTLLQLRHGTIPPSPHAEPANPNIDFAGSPFTVATEATPWPARTDGPPRLAAVSSFGAGGANGHVIIEEYRGKPAAPAGAPGPRLVVLSARKADRLAAHAAGLARFLRSAQGSDVALDDVAWTLMVGREPFEHRLATVASSTAELADRLEAFAAGRPDRLVVSGAVPAYQDHPAGESDADRDYLAGVRAGGDLRRLGELWTQGWTIGWERLAVVPAGRVVSLPTYPFAPERHWIVPEEYQRVSVPAPSAVPAPAADPAPVVAAAGAHEEFRAKLGSQITGIFAELTKLPAGELDPDADFVDFGFDSVVSVRMLNRLMKVYGVRIPGTVIDDYTTIRGLTDHLVDSGVLAGTGPGTGPTGRLGRILAEPARDVEPVALPAPLPFDSILMSGVTGVLGARLLHDLLSKTDARIRCLVRADSPEAALERIGRLLAVYDEEGALRAELRRRVTPVLGDVTLDRFGLDEAALAELAADVDVTIHAAARTTLVSFYDSLAPINVDGTQRMIDFALRTQHRHLVYVSSFSALGDWLLGDNRPFTEFDLELGQEYDHLPYQETKYHAEKLVRAASDDGLMWTIVRPGNIMGDSVTGRYPFGEVNVKGVYYDLLKTVVDTGISAVTANHWDITPVDYVSGGIVELGLRRASYRETYHLTNPDIRGLNEIFEHVQAFGYDVRAVPVREFHRMAVERLFRSAGSDDPYDSQTIEMIKYGIETWGPEHYEHSCPPDATYTRSLLEPAGIHCPTIAELVPMYLTHCVNNGLFPPPVR
ncbi:beta-ketoacyl synthase N-terminal-like domain-containing protein [Dactylosporangium sp. NPDC049525]|uniref:beta-ketoacyl synthase N-terminal-like domain-containing protein n=1 Tax=Dactylosporangium sp. NPDC049525 TaxID=3154730 RepID=UPI00343EF320